MGTSGESRSEHHPYEAQMIAEYGSGEAWQRAKTHEWIAKLVSVATSASGVVFDGQTRPSFLAEAAAAMGNMKYNPILIDCDDRTRARRLSHDRQQPELVTDDMTNWARYLRREAQAHRYDWYDWAISPGKPDSWAIFRCGALTEAGKLALSPM